MKNPYDSDTPEYQLWENMKHHESLARTFGTEAELSLKKAARAREIADRFDAALRKLTETPTK